MDDKILVLSQLSQMASAILAGVFGGLGFEIYQKICYGSSKRRLRPRAYLKGDALFALCLIVFWLIFWFTCTDGSLRLFVFVWLALGFGLYFLALRQSLHLLLRRLVALFRLFRAMFGPDRSNADQDKTTGPRRPMFNTDKMMNDSAQFLVKLDHQAIYASQLAGNKVKTAAISVEHKSREHVARIAKQSQDYWDARAQWGRRKVKWLTRKITDSWRRLGIRREPEDEGKK